MPKPPLSRRTVLKAGAATAVASTAVAAIPSTAQAVRPDTGVSAYPFPLSAVRLLAGPFQANAGRTMSYLTFLDADRLLHMFRVNAGLASSATPCGGWESPTTELRGHSIGHVLSALAQAYASTGDASYAITAGGAGAEQRIDAPAALPAGVWTHVAVTHTGNLGVLYVNGVEAARNASLTTRPANLGSTTQNWIGRSQYGGDPFLSAAVDSLRVYSRALSASEIAALYSSGQ